MRSSRKPWEGRLAVAALVTTVALLAGCGHNDRPRSRSGGGTVIAPRADEARAAGASCFRKRLRTAPFPGESGVYRAGPLMLLTGEDLAQTRSRRHGRAAGSEAIAVLGGGRPVVVSVDPRSRVRFSLQYTPLSPGSPVARIRDGREAVRFPLCGRGRHPLPGGILFAGRGCARLDVLPVGRTASTMLLPIAGSLRGCPPASSGLPASAEPYLGVACPGANAIACDRVAIGVTLRRPATLVTVSVAGRLVTLSPSKAGTPGEVLWQGHLERAGLRRGPLAIDLPAGDRRWLGSPIVRAPVRVTAFFADGTAAARDATVELHPGYG